MQSKKKKKKNRKKKKRKKKKKKKARKERNTYYAQGTFCVRPLHLFSLHGFRQPEVSRMNAPSTRADC